MAVPTDRNANAIAVCGSASCAGQTTIAINLALALHQSTGAPTALVDLDIVSGACSNRLAIASPVQTLADLAALDPSALDGETIDAAMIPHASGVQMLCASKVTEAESSTDETNIIGRFGGTFQRLKDTIVQKPSTPHDIPRIPNVAAVIDHLKSKYQYVVLDMPSGLLASEAHVMAQASTVLIVANLYDVSSINDTRKLLAMIQAQGIKHESIKIALNRATRQNRLPLTEIESALGLKIAAQIPNDPTVVNAAIKDGAPFVLSKPDSAIAQTIIQLAKSLR